MIGVIAKLDTDKQVELLWLLARFAVTLLLLALCAYILAVKAEASEIDKNLAAMISGGVMTFWLTADAGRGGGGSSTAVAAVVEEKTE